MTKFSTSSVSNVHEIMVQHPTTTGGGNGSVNATVIFHGRFLSTGEGSDAITMAGLRL